MGRTTEVRRARDGHRRRYGGRHGEMGGKRVRRESGEDDKGESRERQRERGAGGGTEERV